MSRRVLVVEDEEDLRDIARFTLEGAGFEVIEAIIAVMAHSLSQACRCGACRRARLLYGSASG